MTLNVQNLFQTTSKKVTDSPSKWHSVLLERVGRTGSVVVDSVKTDFSTPGVSANLIVGTSFFFSFSFSFFVFVFFLFSEEPVYIGAIDFDETRNRQFPSAVWSIALRFLLYT